MLVAAWHQVERITKCVTNICFKLPSIFAVVSYFPFLKFSIINELRLIAVLWSSFWIHVTNGIIDCRMLIFDCSIKLMQWSIHTNLDQIISTSATLGTCICCRENHLNSRLGSKFNRCYIAVLDRPRMLAFNGPQKATSYQQRVSYSNVCIVYDQITDNG